MVVREAMHKAFNRLLEYSLCFRLLKLHCVEGVLRIDIWTKGSRSEKAFEFWLLDLDNPLLPHLRDRDSRHFYLRLINLENSWLIALNVYFSQHRLGFECGQ
jgi:hypothetical protein